MVIGYISQSPSQDASITGEKDRVFCRIGCSDKDENICDWNPHLLECGICNKQLTFLIQINKNVSEDTNLIFYIFFCSNIETKCAFTVQGWKVFRNSSNTPTFMKFPKHLPLTFIKFKNAVIGIKKQNLNNKENILLNKYNQRKGDDDWAADEGDQGWVGETYERDRYKDFIKLQDQIAKDPKQVIRCYEPPLLMERLPKLPTCKDCHSQLEFAFQLLPTLGYHLSKHRNLSEYYIDVLCNNLLVFSCPKCIDNSFNLIEEFAILQMEY